MLNLQKRMNFTQFVLKQAVKLIATVISTQASPDEI